jgi:hypothetical protein
MARLQNAAAAASDAKAKVDNIKIDLREVGWEARTGSIWLRIGTGGGLL